jgi:ferredoxin
MQDQKRHTVRLEPVGIEFEVDEDETVLDGAFRQGLMLMHGCKEGQCAACKSFLLDGDVDLDKYSTFALPDYEEAEGWTLLCRAHAYSDLEVELINYDEEILRSGVTLRTVRGTSAGWCWPWRRGRCPSAAASTSTSGSRGPTSTARSRWPTSRRTTASWSS